MLGKRNQISSIRNQILQRLAEKHESLSQFAVLFRTHAQSRSLEEAFLTAGVPYKIVGGVRFYDRKEVKDALSYLRIMLNLRDGIALSRAFSVPPKGIGEKTGTIARAIIISNFKFQISNTEDEQGSDTLYIEENQQLIERTLAEIAGLSTAKGRSSVTTFFNQLFGWLAAPGELELSALVSRVINESGLIKFYTDGTPAGDTRVENLQELVAVAAKYGGKSWQEALPEFLQEVALVSDLDAVADTDDAVTLMTLHSAKGLEFDTVFFVGLEEGLLPHSRSILDPKALAEEVRLAYVGITRAKKTLYITYARQRSLYGDRRASVPSRYLRNLPEHAVSLQGRQGWISGGSGDLNDGGIEYEPFEE